MTDLKPHLLRLSGVLLAACALLAALALGVAQPAQAQQRAPQPTPQPLFALPDARRSPSAASSTLALTDDNRTLVATNLLNNTLSVVAPGQGRLLAEIPVGRDPRTVALTSDGRLAVVANRGDSTLSLVDVGAQQVTATIALGGLWPYGVVLASPDQALVSLQGSDEVVVVDLVEQAVTARIAVPSTPTGLALWGDFLYVTHFWSGDVSLVYLPQRRLVATINTGLDTGLSAAIELDASRGIAYVPQTRSNAQNANLTFDTIVFPVVNVIRLDTLTRVRDRRITLDTADRPVNMPFASALDRFQNWLYVANAGSDSVSVIDLDTGQALGNVRVGSNPRGLLLNRDNSLLFVHNVLDGTLSIVDTRSRQVVDDVPISDLTIPVDILLGAQFFYSAADPRLSANHWVSCANCHFDGMSDGRVWRGFADGPRNTPLLFNLLETAPYNWSGTWGDLAAVELKLRSLQAGTGLVAGQPSLADLHAGVSLDLDTLVTYLTALTGPPVAAAAADQRARGRRVFEAQGCAECHVGPAGTDLQRHDVGTGDDPAERAGVEFDTPSLRWLRLSAPYLHDGRAASLRELFRLPGAHQLSLRVTDDDLDDLLAYLLSLPE